MPWEYIFLLLVSAFICFALAMFAWQRRNAPGAYPFIVMMGAMVFWTLAYIFELVGETYVVKDFWLRMEYVGIAIVPIAWLLFSMEYAGLEHLVTRRNIIWISILPVFNIIVCLTNDWHHLFWLEVTLVESGSATMLEYIRGSLFALHAFTSYALLAAGLGWIVWSAYKRTGYYRKQALTMVAGVLFSLIPNIMVVFEINPLAPLDLTPFAFTLSGVFMASAFLRYRLMDILPVARSTVIESMSDAVLVLDVQNRIVDINPAMAALLDQAPNDLLGQPGAEALQRWPELRQRYRGVMDTRSEIQIPSAEEMRYFDLRISPLYAQGEELSGRLVVLRDITERKLAEDTLRAQKKLFENLVAVARATTERPTLAATLRNVLNVSMGLTEAERGSLFLLDADHKVTQSILARGEAKPSEQDFLVGRAMDRGLAGWAVRNQETALVSDIFQDNRWVPLADETFQARSVLAVPVTGDIGTVGVLTLEHSRVAHFHQEHLILIRSACDQMAMTLRNAQMFEDQSQLANREAILNRVLQAVGEHLNPQVALRVAVDTVAELTGWSAIAILLPDQEDTHLEVLAAGGALSLANGWRIPIENGITGRTYRTGQSQNISDIQQDPDYVVGSGDICSEVCVPLRRGKRIIGVLDVESDRYAAFQPNDLQLIESLGEAIALSLESAQLYDALVVAKVAAEQANQAKSEFVSLVAHELKVPMTSIKGYAALLSEGVAGPVNQNQDEFLQIIRNNINNMATLVSDLADISRIETGQVRLNLAPVALEAVTQEVLRALQTHLDQKQHALQIDIPSDLPLIQADKARLGQILTNLVSNAIKYTLLRGEISIKAESQPQEAESLVTSGRVTVSIADTGLGIQADEQAKIFSKFFRSADQKIRAESGTGLGLNITKLLVERQGGEIWFESEPGQGTTFYFNLPAAEPSQSEAKAD